MHRRKFVKSLLVLSFFGLLFILTLSTPALPHTQAQTSPQLIESDDALVSLTGTWSSISTADASGNSYLYANDSASDALNLQFQGTSIEIIYVTNPEFGDFAIEIDNIVRRTVVTASDTTMFDNHALIDYLEDGSHTLRVYPVSGTIAIDAFIATPAASPVENAPVEAAAGLTAPVGEITDTTPTFEWTEVAGSTWYRFYLSRSTGVVFDSWYEKNNSILSCAADVCTLTPPVDFVNDTYTWYIHSWGPSGYSDWSAPANFSLNLPIPAVVNQTAPADASTVTTTIVTFEWDHDVNATWYQLWVAGAGTWYKAASICTSTCSVDRILSNATHLWYVQGYGPAGLGSWGTGATFTLDVPKPGVVNKTAPADTSTVITTSVTFEWDHDINAAWYQLSINGTATWYKATTICTTTCMVESTYNNGFYTWNVQPWGPGGTGDLGADFTFTLEIPKPGIINMTAPIGTITDPTPDFTWQEDADATWYNVWIGTSGTSSTTLVNTWYKGSVVCAAGTCSIPAPSTYIGDYMWNIRGYGPGGYGEWATASDFSFNVTLISPTANIDGRSPTFTWSDLGAETTYYQIWVGPTDFSTSYSPWIQSSGNCNGSTCSHSTGITLLSSKTYTWYIRPYGTYGLGTWTQGQAFDIDPVVPNPTSIAGCQIFPANNIWNTPIDTLPVDPNSSLYINTIGATRGLHMDFGSGLWNGAPIGIPYIDVPSTEPTVPISFDYDDESDPGPYPIPDDAPIEGGPNSGGDRHILVVERDNCLLYEVYAAYPQGNPVTSWSAGSGAIWDLTSNAIRGELGWTSADAAGLPILPGLVTYEEVASGEITHAIRFTVPQTRNTYVWPATHYASSRTGIQYPPMGQRFRLKPDFDISGYSPDAQVILQAMKTYGIILADNGSAWYISGAPSENWDNDVLHELDNVTGQYFEAVDVSSLMVDPMSMQVQTP